jgi:hypothetical protein
MQWQRLRRALRTGGWIALACLTAIPASAELTSVDLFVPGDGAVTRDRGSGLDWLDVDQTIGLSYQDIVAGAGGWQAQGWRHATLDEVCDLFQRYFGQGPGAGCTASAPPPASVVYTIFPSPTQASAFIDLFGETHVEAPTGYPRFRVSDGTVTDDDTGDPLVGVASVVWDVMFGSYAAGARRNFAPADVPFEPLPGVYTSGNFLVRASPALPVLGPGAALALGASLAAAGARAARRTRAQA